MHGIWITQGLQKEPIKKTCTPETMVYEAWHGTVLKLPFKIKKGLHEISVGGLELTPDKEYIYEENTDEITFLSPINGLDIIVDKKCPNNSTPPKPTVTPELKKFKNDLAALDGGVKIGQLYRLSANNDYGMTENAVKYLEDPATSGVVDEDIHDRIHE